MDELTKIINDLGDSRKDSIFCIDVNVIEKSIKTIRYNGQFRGN